MTYEESMMSGGAKRRRSDAKITIDIFDIASILTHYFQERGFLAPDEELHPSDIADMFDKTGLSFGFCGHCGTLTGVAQAVKPDIVSISISVDSFLVQVNLCKVVLNESILSLL